MKISMKREDDRRNQRVKKRKGENGLMKKILTKREIQEKCYTSSVWYAKN